MNESVPSCCNRWIDWVQRTGPVSWPTMSRRSSLASWWTCASALKTCGRRSGRSGIWSQAAANTRAAPAISGEWNAPLTGSRTRRLAPAACNFGLTAFSPDSLPEITTCPGAL